MTAADRTTDTQQVDMIMTVPLRHCPVPVSDMVQRNKHLKQQVSLCHLSYSPDI